MTSLSIIAGVNSWKSCALILSCKKKISTSQNDRITQRIISYIS